MSKSYPNDAVNTIVVKCFNMDEYEGEKINIINSNPSNLGGGKIKQTSPEGVRGYHTSTINNRSNLVRNNFIKPLSAKDTTIVAKNIIA
jgi:hypothetical protein